MYHFQNTSQGCQVIELYHRLQEALLICTRKKDDVSKIAFDELKVSIICLHQVQKGNKRWTRNMVRATREMCG